MSHLEETVYNGKDNTIDLVLQEDGAAIDHSAITRVKILFAGGLTDLDSDTSPALFDYADAAKLTLKLGTASLPVGEYRATLEIYDPANTNGIRWETVLHLAVKV